MPWIPHQWVIVVRLLDRVCGHFYVLGERERPLVARTVTEALLVEVNVAFVDKTLAGDHYSYAYFFRQEHFSIQKGFALVGYMDLAVAALG